MYNSYRVLRSVIYKAIHERLIYSFIYTNFKGVFFMPKMSKVDWAKWIANFAIPLMIALVPCGETFTMQMNLLRLM